MRIAKVLHKSEYRIKVDFPYNRIVESELRKIKGTKWSKTMNAWHIPYSKSAYLQLKLLFPEVEISVSAFADVTEIKDESEPLVKHNLENTKKGITIEINGRKIILKMPRNTADIAFINSIKFSKWNAGGYFWQIPNYGGNIQMIKNYFGDRIVSFTESESISIAVGDMPTVILGKNEVLGIKTQSGRLKLLFGYQPSLQKLLRAIPYHVWDSRNKWWTIPYSEIFLN